MKREHQCRTTAPIDIKWMISWYDEQLYYSKLSNLDEMHKFLEKTQLRKCNTENCNNHVHIWEIVFITKSFHKENFMPRWLYWCVISDIYGRRNTILNQFFQKNGRGNALQHILRGEYQNLTKMLQASRTTDQNLSNIGSGVLNKLITNLR